MYEGVFHTMWLWFVRGEGRCDRELGLACVLTVSTVKFCLVDVNRIGAVVGFSGLILSVCGAWWCGSTCGIVLCGER